MKRFLLAVLMLTLPSAIPLHVEGAKKPSRKTTPSPILSVQSKICGYSLRYPRGSQLEHPEDCILKIILPPFPGQDWIQDVSLTLEVTDAENGEATESPVDGEEPVRYFIAGGMKFEKTVEEDAGAGHVHVMVSYTAVGKKHQYHFLGIMSAANPEVEGKPVKNWDAQKSAEKLFDGLILSFRPLE